MILQLVRRLSNRYRLRRDPVAWSRQQGVRIGNDCRLLAVTSGTFGSEPYLITIGDHVTITEGVRFVTHDGGVWVLRGTHPEVDVFAPIVVGNNVFLGMGATLFPGVTIGNDVVVGAGSVVTRSVPDGSVVAGVPARVISNLDSYRKKSLQKAMMTKSLSAAAKRAVLEARFPRDQD